MKNSILILSLLFSGIASAQTTTIEKTTTDVIVVNEQVKTPIKVEELPEKIQTILNDPSLAAWKVVAAYVVKEEIEYYEIELQNEDEQKATIKLDREGVEIK